MNLLPSTEKKIVRQDYNRRMAVVGFSFLSALLSMVLISVTVSYIVSSYEIMILRREIEEASRAGAAEGVVANAAIIKRTNERLEILNRKIPQDLPYELSSALSSIVASSTVKLTSLSYNQASIKKGQAKEISHRIIVGGVAGDREDLQEFVRTLESDGRFSAVELPVSSLIESTDISFFITLTMAKK